MEWRDLSYSCAGCSLTNFQHKDSSALPDSGLPDGLGLSVQFHLEEGFALSLEILGHVHHDVGSIHSNVPSVVLFLPLYRRDSPRSDKALGPEAKYGLYRNVHGPGYDAIGPKGFLYDSTKTELQRNETRPEVLLYRLIEVQKPAPTLLYSLYHQSSLHISKPSAPSHQK